MIAQLLRAHCLALALAALLADATRAAGPPSGCWGLPRWLSAACGCCDDDYCVKPLPPVECPPGQCLDNYCAKPLPPVACESPGRGAGCYDLKPLPPVPRCCEPWYRCLPFCGK